MELLCFIFFSHNQSTVSMRIRSSAAIKPGSGSGSPSVSVDVVQSACISSSSRDKSTSHSLSIGDDSDKKELEVHTPKVHMNIIIQDNQNIVPPNVLNSPIVVERKVEKKSRKFESFMFVVIIFIILLFTAMSLVSVNYMIPALLALEYVPRVVIRVVLSVLIIYCCGMCLLSYLIVSFRGKKDRNRHISSIKTGVTPVCDLENGGCFENVGIPKCSKCGHLRPLRTHHCSLCGVCTSKYDHHCSYIGSCIGQHNYGYFYRLLVHTVLAPTICTLLFLASIICFLVTFSITGTGMYALVGIDAGCIVIGLIVIVVQGKTLKCHRKLMLAGTTSIEFDLLEDLYLLKRLKAEKKAKKNGITQTKYKECPSIEEVLSISPFRKNKDGNILTKKEVIQQIFGQHFGAKIFLPLIFEPEIKDFNYWEYLRDKIDIRFVGKNNS